MGARKNKERANGKFTAESAEDAEGKWKREERE
jgi:hypothetical protein